MAVSIRVALLAFLLGGLVRLFVDNPTAVFLLLPSARALKRLLLFFAGLLASFLLACFVAAITTELLPIAHDTTTMAIFLVFALSVLLLTSLGGYVSAVIAVLRRAARRRSPNEVAKAMTVFLVAAQSVFFLVCVAAYAAAIAAVFRSSEQRAIFIAAAVLACHAACAFWFYKESGAAVILGRGVIHAAA